MGGTEGPEKVCSGWAGFSVLTGGSGSVRQIGSLHKDGSSDVDGVTMVILYSVNFSQLKRKELGCVCVCIIMA